MDVSWHLGTVFFTDDDGNRLEVTHMRDGRLHLYAVNGENETDIYLGSWERDALCEILDGDKP